MALALNILPVALSSPDVVLPNIPVPEGAKVTDFFPGIRKYDTATRTVWTPGGRHIVFLRGNAPDGRKTGRHLYEWTVTGSLPLAAIEYSIADELCSRFEVRWHELNRRPWGLLILQEVKKLSFEHLRFLEGVYLRAVHLAKPGEYGIVVNWRAKSEFRTNLAHDDIGKIAPGCSVILQETNVPEELERFVGRFTGRVKQLNGDSAEVILPNGDISSIPRGWLVLESSPHNVASFDGAYPSLRPREGTVVARLRLDKTLVGNNRNSSIYKDRLAAALAFLNPNAERQRLFPLCSDGAKHVTVGTSPLLSESRPDRLPRHFSLPQPDFLYKDDKTLPGNKKTEGMLKYGPYQQQPIGKPLFGFLFAESHRDDARKLFAGLRDGTGYYKGFQAWFKVPISNSSVVSVSGFDVTPDLSPAEAAVEYAKQLDNWLAGHTGNLPDIFFIVHDKTEHEEEDSPYYACKAVLLRKGVMTQNVTVDLIRNSSQFQWAASNIALAAFAKLGGTPWSIEPSSTRKSLVIGIGRTEKVDFRSRQRRTYQAFATCSSSTGRFGFVSVHPEVDEDNIVESLKKATVLALSNAEKLNLPYDSLVIHLTGELKRDEVEGIEEAVGQFHTASEVPVCVLSVSEDNDIFVVDDGNPAGIPSRGVVIQLRPSEYLLLTEGNEDLGAARFRTPCSVRIRIRRVPDGLDAAALIAQVYDLAQVNFRGFNAASKPVSVLYSELIARVLRCENVAEALAERQELSQRMWFL
jgi:Piwi domain